MSDVRDCDTKVRLFPTTSDRLRMSPQLVSNNKKMQFDFLQKYWRVLFVAIPDIRHNSIFHLVIPTQFNFLPFLSDNKKYKVSSILPFRHSSAGNRHTGKSVLRKKILFLDIAPKELQKVSNISITAKYDYHKCDLTVQ